MQEIWREIPHTQGDYSVSNTGKVRGNARRGADGRRLKEKELKPTVTRTGYHVVTIMENGEKPKYLVSRLVYCTFKGVSLDMELDVHHKDHNKSNNALDNLEAITRSENIKESYKHQKKKKNTTRQKQNIRNLSKAWEKTSKPIVQYTTEGEEVKEYKAVNHVFVEKGYDPSAISRCANGKQKTSYGFIWRWK